MSSSAVVAAAPRVAAMVAGTALPALLPTPPRSKMLPLLPTPCLIILPANFATAVASKAPKSGRADAVDRWDAHKKPAGSSPPPSRPSSVSASRAAASERKEPGSPASSCSSSSSSSGGKPGRAYSCERWDTNKIKNQSSSCHTPASSNARWDINKIKNTTPPSISERRSDSSKRPVSRGSSAERWDINKKHRSQDDEAAALGSASDRKLTTVKQPLFSGPAFLISSPEPSMLPMPTFLMAR
uniref:Uncharacterized protein n=1 Tax=Oryza punctata TaxID=4537 RepID=A0A0E0MCL5_ORYPU